MKESRNTSRCQVGITGTEVGTDRRMLSGSASSSRTIRRATSDLLVSAAAEPKRRLDHRTPLSMRPPLSKHQAAWVTSQEHDAGHQDAADDFEEAVHQMDLEAIDAPIERAAASQKLQAARRRTPRGQIQSRPG
eukprot:scaffold90243_cov51-Phaeocystis_antarctica.AAC.1